MSAAPSEPEKYSIDEMMDRLKGSPAENPEDGELVTRSDGSQAIRVRKRKRRSSQPHKEQSVRTRRARIIQVSAALILVFLAVLTVGGAVIYANSSPFREGLLQKIGQSTGATTDLSQFRMNPKTANANDLTLEWPAGNLLRTLTVRGINAEVFPTSFLGKSMTGEEVTVAEGNLTLQIPKPGTALRTVNKVEGELPIRFNRYRTPVLNLTLGSPESPILRLYKSEASLTSETQAGLPQMRLYRGDLAISGWPNLRMNRALIEFRGNEINVVSLQVFHPGDDRGSLGLTGTISPYKQSQTSNLAASLDAFLVEGLAGAHLGHIISGRIDSVSAAKSNYFSFLPVENSSPTLDIAFSVTPSSNIEFQGFPFLLGIAQLLDGDEWFEKPVFDTDATGTFHREKGVITFRDLNFVSKGRMAIQGELSMAANEALSGKLRVGLSEAMIPKTSRLKTMMGPAKEGFRWITLNIGGSAVSPTDNFKDLFTEAGATKEPAPAPDGTERSTFDELTRPR
ncbi:MAG: hypothetical protein ABIS50_17955 [Luteolibacter sp.]|uniref:hypothetical protein n=1 Tax=Luteolibacter sp. TaxID=1962973 RepID=UPI003262EA98